MGTISSDPPALPLSPCRYGFNSGSTNCFYGCMALAAKIAVNTSLSVGAGGITCLFVSVIMGNPGDIGPLLNGGWGSAVGRKGSGWGC